jgi:DNA-binding response OmpR family regulator
LTLDLDLPGRDGVPLISELREEPLARDLPIIVVSALARAEQAVQLGGIEVADWLVKPIDHARLMAAMQRSASLAGTRRARILHVDDDADVLSVVSAIAADLGDFDHAGDLRTARQLLASQHYDLVILDLALPDGSGTELLPLIAAMRPEPRVLVFSASELPRKQTERFAASLVKSVTSNADLLNIIHAQIKR